MDWIYPPWWSLIPHEYYIFKLVNIYFSFKIMRIFLSSKLDDINKQHDERVRFAIRADEEFFRLFSERFRIMVTLSIRENYERYAHSQSSVKYYIDRFCR